MSGYTATSPVPASIARMAPLPFAIFTQLALLQKQRYSVAFYLEYTSPPLLKNIGFPV